MLKCVGFATKLASLEHGDVESDCRGVVQECDIQCFMHFFFHLKKTPVTFSSCWKTVYETVCQQCGCTYLGMTMKRLHERMREHMAVARRKDENTAFGAHFMYEHPKSKPKINFSIIVHQPDELRSHVKEAMAIKTRQPELNRRQEELGTGFLP